jgi:hypothetical protein
VFTKKFSLRSNDNRNQPLFGLKDKGFLAKVEISSVRLLFLTLRG